MRSPIKLLSTGTATTKDMRNHQRNGCMPLVSITNDHTLKSRMMGNYHVRFGSGGGGSNPFANHNHHELSHGKHFGYACTPAMAAGLADHIWTVQEVLTYKIAPAPWIDPKQPRRSRKKVGSDSTEPKRPRGRPRKHPLPDPTVPKRPRGRPRKVA